MFKFVKPSGSEKVVVYLFLSFRLDHINECATFRPRELRVWVIQNWNRGVRDERRRDPTGEKAAFATWTRRYWKTIARKVEQLRSLLGFLKAMPVVF